MEQDKLPTTPLVKKKCVKEWVMFVMSLFALVVSIFALLMYQKFNAHFSENANTSKIDTLTSNIQVLKANVTALANAHQIITNKINEAQKILQALPKEQSQSSNDWPLKKALYYLELAQINAEWLHNIPSTMSLLKQADLILAKISDLPVQNTRQAIAQDLLKLEQIPPLDTPGILAKLQAIQKEIHTLTKKAPNLFTQTLSPPTSTTWREHLRNNLHQLQSLIIIHHQDEHFLSALSPQYLIFIRENIYLNLQEAQIGLMAHQQSLYCAGLSAAITNLNYGFHPDAPKTQSIIRLLTSLQKMNITQEKLSLSDYKAIINNDLSIDIETYS